MEGGRNIARRDETRVNKRIRAREVRVVDEEGNQLGVMPTRDAYNIAQEQGVDLVEVAPNANPPVCKVMDYGKYKYEQKKAASAQKQKQKTQSLKEIKFRPNIGDHDLDFKVKHIREFLEDDNKVKVRIYFRGREIVHPEIGKELAKNIYDRVTDIGQLDSQPRIEGKNLFMILAPKKKS